MSYQLTWGKQFLPLRNIPEVYCKQIIARHLLAGYHTQSLTHRRCAMVIPKGKTVSALQAAIDKAAQGDTADRNLSSSPSATFTFTSSPKVRFIYLDFSREPESIISGRQSHAYNLTCFVGRRIAQPCLLRNLTSRHFQFKELNDPQPCFKRNINRIQPSIRKVLKAFTASFAAVSAIANPINFIAVTIAAKNMAVFPAIFFEIFSSSKLGFTYGFKGVKGHRYKINLVPNLL